MMVHIAALLISFLVLALANDNGPPTGNLPSLTVSTLVDMDFTSSHYVLVLPQRNAFQQAHHVLDFFLAMANQVDRLGTSAVRFHLMECAGQDGNICRQEDGVEGELLFRELCEMISDGRSVAEIAVWDAEWRRYDGPRSGEGLMGEVQRSMVAMKGIPSDVMEGKPLPQGLAQNGRGTSRIQAYWINLDTHIDRSFQMQSSLDKSEVEAEVDAHRVSAVDCIAAAALIKAAGLGTIVSTASNNVCAGEVPEIESIIDDRGKGKEKPVRVVEVACTLSHITAIWNAYISGNEYAMILEDDVLLDADHSDRFKPYELRSLVSDLQRQMPKGFLVQLYCNNPWIRTQEMLKMPTRTAVHTRYFCYGAQQYLVSRPCMRSILERYAPDVLKEGADVSRQDLQDAFVNTLKQNEVLWIAEPAIYTVCPHFISSRPYGVQTDGVSSIAMDPNGRPLASETPESLFDYFYANIADEQAEAPSLQNKWNFVKDFKTHPHAVLRDEMPKKMKINLVSYTSRSE